MAIAQGRLGEQLRWLYEQGEPDPIAVILGATSLENAIEGLESISRAARATESVLADARSARARLTLVRKDLALRAERTKAARAQVLATTADLERSRSERAGYIAELQREQALTAVQIASLEQRAQAAQKQAQQVTQQASAAGKAADQAAPETATATPATTAPTTAEAPTFATAPETPAGPSEPPPPPVESVSESGSSAPVPAAGPPRPGGTMRVLATAYCLRGSTATGLPVGHGIVAVDPTTIPLGTRMTIPGYGEGVAADVGSGITGARIDVWIASCPQAIAFTRSVTITFH